MLVWSYVACSCYELESSSKNIHVVHLAKYMCRLTDTYLFTVRCSLALSTIHGLFNLYIVYVYCLHWIYVAWCGVEISALIFLILFAMYFVSDKIRVNDNDDDDNEKVKKKKMKKTKRECFWNMDMNLFM